MAARATTATVLARMGTGAVYWTNHDATSVGLMCTAASYKLDGYTYPHVLSTTGTKEIELATDIVMNMIAYADWGAAGQYLTGQPRPIILTQDIKDMADNLVIGVPTSTDDTVDMIE